MPAPDPAIRQHIENAVDKALAGPAQRITWIEGPTGPLWLKRIEKLSFYWRLRKGDSGRAFEADRQALHLLGQAGLPVPPILLEGPDYFVTPHSGDTLAHVLRHSTLPESVLLQVFAQAGGALAQLHLAGFRHGRPSIRDMLWDGIKITMIDFERFRIRKNRPFQMAIDLLIMTQSVFAYSATATSAAQALCAGYRSAAPEHWARARTFAQVIQGPVRLAAAMPFSRGLGKDLRALGKALTLLSQG